MIRERILISKFKPSLVAQSLYKVAQSSFPTLIPLPLHVPPPTFSFLRPNCITCNMATTTVVVIYSGILFSMDRATKERGPCKKQRSDISQYRPNKRGQ